MIDAALLGIWQCHQWKVCESVRADKRGVIWEWVTTDGRLNICVK